MMTKPVKRKPAETPPLVDVKPASYEPNEAELCEDLQADISFEEALDLLVENVAVKQEHRIQE